MNAQEYIPLAMRTCKVLPFRQHAIHMGLGIAGEFGEFIDAVKKAFVYGKPVNPDDKTGPRIFGRAALDHTNSIEEAGDCLWYPANMYAPLAIPYALLDLHLQRGYERGLGLQQKLDVDADLNMGDVLLKMNVAAATEAAKWPDLHPEMAPGTATAIGSLETVIGNIGMLCGILGVDPTLAKDRNIAKLKARHGDKYNEVGVIERDLDNERRVLEGGAA
jgi:NTP pyrophosphatase (non-canonical NTP hydrolase)